MALALAKYRKSSIKHPPSNKPPPPPPPVLSGAHQMIDGLLTVLINRDCKTSCGLIRNGLFTNWKIGFDSDPWLHDLKRLVLGLFHFAFQFVMEN